jgi:hypothetical protein
MRNFQVGRELGQSWQNGRLASPLRGDAGAIDLVSFPNLPEDGNFDSRTRQAENHDELMHPDAGPTDPSSRCAGGPEWGAGGEIPAGLGVVGDGALPYRRPGQEEVRRLAPHRTLHTHRREYGSYEVTVDDPKVYTPSLEDEHAALPADGRDMQVLEYNCVPHVGGLINGHVRKVRTPGEREEADKALIENPRGN